MQDSFLATQNLYLNPLSPLQRGAHFASATIAKTSAGAVCTYSSPAAGPYIRIYIQRYVLSTGSTPTVLCTTAATVLRPTALATTPKAILSVVRASHMLG